MIPARRRMNGDRCRQLLPTVAAATLLWVVAGCVSAPPTDLEALRNREAPPTLADIEELERDQEAYALARAKLETHPDASWSEPRLRDLRLHARDLDARRDLILERAAASPLSARALFEDLEGAIMPLSLRRGGIERELATLRVQGLGDSAGAAKLSAKLPAIDERIASYESWQNELSRLRGFDRTAAHGWPALDGAAERRRGLSQAPEARAEQSPDELEDE